MIGYWVAQLVGGIVAALSVRWLFSSQVADALVSAPAIVAGDFSKIWIYLVGPLAGGMVGGLIYLVRPTSRAGCRVAA